jgi:hypothetical protein
MGRCRLGPARDQRIEIHICWYATVKSLRDEKNLADLTVADKPIVRPVYSGQVRTSVLLMRRFSNFR